MNRWLKFATGVFLSGALCMLSACNSTGPKETIFVGGLDKIMVLDGNNYNTIGDIEVHGPVQEMYPSSDGKKLYASTNERRELAVIDTKTRKVEKTISFQNGDTWGSIFGLTVTPDGKQVIVQMYRTQRALAELKSLPPQVLVLNSQDLSVMKTYEVPYGTCSLAMPAEGKDVFIYGRDVLRMNIETGEMKKETALFNPAPNESVTNVLPQWQTDREADNFGTAPAIISNPEKPDDAKMGVLTADLKTGEFKKIAFDAPIDGYFGSVGSKDHKKVYMIGNNVAAYDLETKKLIKSVPTKHGTCYSINVSNDGKKLYLTGAGNTFTVVNADTFEVIKDTELPTDTIHCRVVMVP
ncbi:hypothetical protein GTO89_07985 [Heliobacterium gestii]|uniref:Uncharacterized protein n=1 Tax=Heliomicrobium gestii TaxID=2699 RepID=A0A845L8L5_HELGE|nr:hypothetical protein [Heliomicrobium gestii]MBM7866232.1 DNA-binding beta-propeller fold protein YncE [Heliomicrobium gestii]MZP42972.1 hypothetical protein [Heliomicrobium gestii]